MARDGAILRRLLGAAMPTFLGIGAGRAGTTWLWENLRRHPAVWTPRTKELKFFDHRFHKRRVPFLGSELEARLRYASRFAVGALRGKVTGEISPSYAVLPLAQIALVHAWIPEGRILYMMRDPVLRAWSQASRSFPRINGKPVDQASPTELVRFFELPQIARASDYFTCLTNWLTFYDRRQLFVCVTEDLSTNAVGVLRELYRFLGVDPDLRLDAESVAAPVHPGAPPRIPEGIREYLVETLYEQKRRLESLIGRKLPWG